MDIKAQKRIMKQIEKDIDMLVYDATGNDIVYMRICEYVETVELEVFYKDTCRSMPFILVFDGADTRQIAIMLSEYLKSHLCHPNKNNIYSYYRQKVVFFSTYLIDGDFSYSDLFIVADNVYNYTISVEGCLRLNDEAFLIYLDYEDDEIKFKKGVERIKKNLPMPTKKNTIPFKSENKTTNYEVDQIKTISFSQPFKDSYVVTIKLIDGTGYDFWSHDAEPLLSSYIDFLKNYQTNKE